MKKTEVRKHENHWKNYGKKRETRRKISEQVDQVAQKRQATDVTRNSKLHMK